MVSGQPSPGERENQLPVHLFRAIVELTTWPDDVLAPAERQFRVGIAGSGDAVAEAAELLEGWSIGGRVVVVQAVGAQRLEAFHVVYCVRGWTGALPKPLPRGVLVTGQGEEFIAAGGAVAFVQGDDRTRFDVHLDRVTRCGLRVGAPLLQMARRVVRSAGGLDL